MLATDYSICRHLKWFGSQNGYEHYHQWRHNSILMCFLRASLLSSGLFGVDIRLIHAGLINRNTLTIPNCLNVYAFSVGIQISLFYDV